MNLQEKKDKPYSFGIRSAIEMYIEGGWQVSVEKV